MPTKLLIVVYHRVFAQGLEALFAAEPDFDPMVAASPEQAFDVVTACKPDAVLLDARLGNVSGIDLARRLARLPSPPAVIVLAACADRATAVEAAQAGAVGFVAKNASVEEVMNAVRAATLGGTWLPAGLFATLLADFGAPADNGDQLIGQLTAREQHVLSLLVSGMDRNRIASQLHRSPNTVRTYIQNMTAKLGCHSAIEMVAVALRAGLRPR